MALQVSDAAQTKYMDDGPEGKRGKLNGATTFDLKATDLIKEDLVIFQFGNKLTLIGSLLLTSCWKFFAPKTIKVNFDGS